MRALILSLMTSAEISLIGIIVLLAMMEATADAAVFMLLALGLVDMALRWRWRKALPPPSPEALLLRRSISKLILGLGGAFVIVQAILLIRDQGLTRDAPIWPGMVGVALLATGFIEYYRSRSRGSPGA